jgi:RNA polymerase primary sigma factor
MNQNNSSISYTPNEVRAYLNDVNKTPLITPQEEVELAWYIRKGDKKALDTLTKANLRYVVSVAKQYQNQWLSLSDLINEGNLWLIDAAKRFDETRGFKFISHADKRIRWYILNALSNYGTIVKKPTWKHIRKIQHAFTRFLQENWYNPSHEDLFSLLEADHSEISLSDIEHYFTHQNRDISLNVPFSEDENLEPIDLLIWDNPTPYNNVEDVTRNTLQEVIELLFSDNYTPSKHLNKTIKSRWEIHKELKDILKRFFWVTPYPSPQDCKTIAEECKISETTVRGKIEKIRRIARYKSNNNEELYTLLKDYWIL